jgi:pimeloyl-ACP methyl ester carboxylesterase
MAAASIRTAGVFLVLVPTVAYGGVSLLGFISRRTPGSLDNPVRQNRASHLHDPVHLRGRAAAGRRHPHSRHRTTRRLIQGVDVPTLIVPGDDDQIVPIDASARRSVELVPDATFLLDLIPA